MGSPDFIARGVGDLPDSVGFAVHGGAEASLTSADVFTTDGGLHKLGRGELGQRTTTDVSSRRQLL